MQNWRYSNEWALFCWLLVISTSASMSLFGLNFHRPPLAGLCARSLTCSVGFVGKLTQSTHTGYILTKAWQHAGWAAPSPQFSFTAKEQKDESLIHHPWAFFHSMQLPQNLHYHFYSLKLEKYPSVPRSVTLIKPQPEQNYFKMFSFLL